MEMICKVFTLTVTADKIPVTVALLRLFNKCFLLLCRADITTCMMMRSLGKAYSMLTPVRCVANALLHPVLTYAFTF